MVLAGVGTLVRVFIGQILFAVDDKEGEAAEQACAGDGVAGLEVGEDAVTQRPARDGHLDLDVVRGERVEVEFGELRLAGLDARDTDARDRVPFGLHPGTGVPMKGAVMTTVPPYDGTIFLNGNIITTTDPTTLLNVTDAGQGRRVMFDRRINGATYFDAYLFNAKFDDGLAAEIQVNPAEGLLTSLGAFGPGGDFRLALARGLGQQVGVDAGAEAAMSGSSARKRSRTDPMRVASYSCCQGERVGAGGGMCGLLIVELRRRGRKVYTLERLLIYRPAAE